MISLLTESWIPVRRANGHVDRIAPHQLCEPDIVGFAAPRADFNGALAQFAIGLLQTASPVESEGKWRKRFKIPPQPDELAEWFAPLKAAFALDGDGTRFMQDLGLNDGAACGIDALLIDAAGGSAVDKNTDLFVKRDTVKAMCPHCAAIALFTLQTNAPAGGAGHRTSLRGGGPLTTLLLAAPTQSLWQDLWLNVLPQNEFLARSGDSEKSAPFFIFPWLAETAAIQKPNAETQPVQVHPHHVFWAMPRRIRLDFSDTKTGQCDICKRESSKLVVRYVTKPQGLNYKGPWRHPFSPYYETKEGWLPVHPQPGGFSYRHWLSWAAGSASTKKTVQAAANVTHAASAERHEGRELRLWVFGFDMDNAKPRCWYETIYPFFACKQEQLPVLKELTAVMIEAAEQAVFYLRQAVKQAWFGEADTRGDFSYVDKMFWDSTDAAFYRQLRGLIGHANSEGGLGGVTGEHALANAATWHQELSRKALSLFDTDIVGAGAIAQQDPRRIAQAYQGLRRNLDGKALRNILHLPLPENDKADKASKRKSVKTPEAQSTEET